MDTKKTVFSGIQPTGKITIGNYLGVIKHWITMQDRYHCLFCIVDLHSLTTSFNPNELQENIKYNIALYIAAGLNPKKVIIFQQSKISEHSELAWILSCATQMQWLNRMTQFKDKARKNKVKTNLGLYAYPVLMAADILLYNTHIVPVGEDQKQHIELSRDIAISFNRKLGNDLFTIPDAWIDSKAKRIMSLKDVSNKMSKSDPSDLSRINISDSNELIIKKIRKATTDNIKGISYNPIERPEIANLINIYACFTDSDVEKIASYFNAAKTSEFKESLAHIIIENITPINQKVIQILKGKKYLEQIIKDGTMRAKNIATKNLSIIKQVVGIN